MVKPVGPNVLVKIIKQKSSLELLPGTDVGNKDLVIRVEAVGTSCSLGVQVGHEVLIADKLSAIIVEETENYDLLIIPENAVKGIKNWVDEVPFKKKLEK